MASRCHNRTCCCFVQHSTKRTLRLPKTFYSSWKSRTPPWLTTCGTSGPHTPEQVWLNTGYSISPKTNFTSSVRRAPKVFRTSKPSPRTAPLLPSPFRISRFCFRKFCRRRGTIDRRLIRSSEFLGALKIEFAGAEDGNGFDAFDDFRDPEIGQA